MTWRAGHISDPIAYWSYAETVSRGRLHTFEDERSALNGLEKVLQTSVARHMLSDVPIGVLLSGRIDSSMVVALMHSQGSRPIKTFQLDLGTLNLTKYSTLVQR